jgi:hypothetical protein
MANTHKDVKLYICVTPQPEELDQEGYEALTWVKVAKVGNLGETGTNTNIVSYPTLDTDVQDKAKGMSDAGSPVIEVARVYNDPGQVALRAAALTNFDYAFKIVRNDAPSEGFSDRVEYQRGKVAGPQKPNGGNEDFDLERFTLGFIQREIVAEPAELGS